MKERFETFVTAIAQIYRCLQKLKSQEMADFGLKGTHVMCLYQLQQHREGLTSTQLAQLCEEDKAAISRTVSELRELDLIGASEGCDRKYRKPMVLTEKGLEVTQAMDQKIIDAVLNAARGYSKEDRETFYHVLLQVSDNLQAACDAREESR